jgi:hypothetical protein
LARQKGEEGERLVVVMMVVVMVVVAAVSLVPVVVWPLPRLALPASLLRSAAVPEHRRTEEALCPSRPAWQRQPASRPRVS